MTAREFWNQLEDHEKIQFMRMRSQEYSQYNDLSKYQFIDEFLDIWRSTGQGQTTKEHQK
jgi:type II restriction/modification system DNA methylase subunit YeeA